MIGQTNGHNESINRNILILSFVYKNLKFKLDESINNNVEFYILGTYLFYLLVI